jgi:hypothetical protein
VAQSGINCVKFGELTLWTPHIYASTNMTDVLIPVNVAQADGLCMAALEVTVSYNHSIVTATGRVSPTIFTQGYSYAANSSTPGQVAIAAINSTCTPLYGPGTLFNVGFNVIGAQSQSSPIDFITGITYTVIYDDNDLFHPIPLSLESGSLTVGNNYTRGDVSGDSYVNVADALVALRISVGQITPTPQQQGACDVNGDAACSAADASLILCYSAGGTWSGCGSSARAVFPSQSWEQGTLAKAVLPSQGGANIVRLGLGTTSAGQAMTTTVTIANGSDFAGGTFTFQYDPNALTFSAASLTGLTNGFGVQSYVVQPGLVRVAVARDTAINADGAILNLRFNVTDNASPISLSDVRLNDAAGRDFVTSALQKQIEFVANQPILNLTATNDSPTVLGGTTHFTATVTTGGDITYTWDFGDGHSGGGQYPAHLYEAIGQYEATVTATDGISTVVATTAVTITDQPILNLTAINDSPTVLGSPTHFTATVTGGTGPITTTWNFGDGTPLLIGNPITHTYSVAGPYTVIVTATNGLNTISATTRVTITQHLVYLPFVTR